MYPGLPVPPPTPPAYQSGYPMGQAPPPEQQSAGGYPYGGGPYGGPIGGYPPAATAYTTPLPTAPPPPPALAPPAPVPVPVLAAAPAAACCLPSSYEQPRAHQKGPKPVFNPSIPYVGALPTLRNEMVIKVCGSTPSNCNRFHINFCRGPGDHEEVDHPMHINPRFDGWISNTVVRSAFLERKWGPDEKSGKMPIRRGENFECLIKVVNDDYKVAFNGTHFCDFKRRSPKKHVTHLNIGGMVKVHSIHVYDPTTGMAPIPYPETGGPPSICKLPVPYSTEIPGGMQTGRMVVIHGVPEAAVTRFAVDLCFFKTVSKDIAFHFNPRFMERTVVCNTMSGSSWGSEVRSSTERFPFEPNKPFQLMILCESGKFKVAVNGKHYLDYNHRLKNLSDIRHIHISGQVYLASVTFQ